MATYLQGVTDFIPQIQPFQPDLNFYGGLMQAKQNQYDQNWNALNKMYGQYFYADLTRDKNIEKKEEYLKDIEFNLKRVSGLDLSLEQNVTQATQVFKPFYEDKFLMKDMAWTKNYMNQRGRGDGLKNSNDEKLRAQYWDSGIKAMDYRREEFKETTDEESMSFGNVSYTPYVNVMDKALKLAKEANLNVETIDFSPDGRWIIKKKNGEALEEPLQKLFEASLGSDPAIGRVYSTQAYVNRKDYSYGNAAQFGGDQKAAEMDYLQRSYETLKTLNEQRVKSLENQQNVQTNKSNTVEQQQKNGNITQENTSYLENLREAMGINTEVLNQAEAIQGQLSDGQGTLTTSSGFQNPYGDLKSLRQKVDAGMASYLMQKDLGEAAHVFAFRNAGIDMDANPYKVLEIKNAAAMARVRARNKGERDNVKLKGLIDAGTMIEAPIYDKDGNIVGVDYEINKKAFNTYVITDPESGMNTPEDNKDVLAEQIAEHYIQKIQQPMVGNMTEMMNYMLEGKMMSEADKNYILNGTRQLGPMFPQKPATLLDRLTGKGGTGNRLQDAFNYYLDLSKVNYDSVDDFNKDFADKDLYYNTDRLAEINGRFADWALKNNPLMEGDAVLQSKLQTYYRSAANYKDYIDVIDGYQGFRKEASDQIVTYLKDNKYKHADLFFDAYGEEVGIDEFTKRLRNKGVIPNVLKREVNYRDQKGNWQTITNKNFEEQALKIGKQRWNAGVASPVKGSGLVSHVHKADEVTIYKADGKVVKVPGSKVKANVSDSKQYVSLMTKAGGWTSNSNYDLYEVNDENRDNIQKKIGEKWIFGGIGGGLGGVRSGERTYQAEYNKLAKAVSNTWSNSNVVKAEFKGIPNFTAGTGAMTFQKEGIQVLPKGHGTPGNIYMNQTIEDINNIDWDGFNSVITNGINETNFTEAGQAEDGELTLTEKGQIIYRDFASKFKDPTSKLQPFNLEVSGIGGSEQLKGAIIMRVPSDFLDEYAQKVNSKGEAVGGTGMLTPKELAGFKNNGLVFISDRNNFNNGLFENVYKDPFEMSVDYNGEYKYNHPSGVGSINVSKRPEGLIGSPYQSTINYKLFNINTGKYEAGEPIVNDLSSLTQETRNTMVNHLDNVRLLNIQNQNIYYGRQ